jgi:hypothetical protein
MLATSGPRMRVAMSQRGYFSSTPGWVVAAHVVVVLMPPTKATRRSTTQILRCARHAAAEPGVEHAVLDAGLDHVAMQAVDAAAAGAEPVDHHAHLDAAARGAHQRSLDQRAGVVLGEDIRLERISSFASSNAAISAG